MENETMTIEEASATLSLSFIREDLHAAYEILKAANMPNLDARYQRAMERVARCDKAQAKRIARGLPDARTTEW